MSEKPRKFLGLFKRKKKKKKKEEEEGGVPDDRYPLW